MPHPGVEYARVGGVHRQVRRARVRVHLEDELPGLAAVFGAIHAALRVRCPDLALDGDVGEIGVGRMHLDLGDLAGLRQPHERERLARVRRLPEPLALRRRHAADRRLAGADVDDVRIRGRDRYRADRADGNLLIGDVLPGLAGIAGFPNAASRCPHVVELVVARHTVHRGNAPPAPWADEPVFQAVEQSFFNGIGVGETRK